MNKQQLIFWKSEREMLERLYRDRMREWKRAGDTKRARIDLHSEPGTQGGLSADGRGYRRAVRVRAAGGRERGGRGG